MSLHPVEWVVREGRPPRPLAVIRFVRIQGEPYWRVVTWAEDPAKRELVGYWGSLEEAEHNVMAAYDAKVPDAWLALDGGRFKERRKPTPMKPPPTAKAPTR